MDGSSLTLREQTSKQTGDIESNIFFRLYESEPRYFSDVLWFFALASGAGAIASGQKLGLEGHTLQPIHQIKTCISAPVERSARRVCSSRRSAAL
jgi:hypothetical protein